MALQGYAYGFEGFGCRACGPGRQGFKARALKACLGMPFMPGWVGRKGGLQGAPRIAETGVWQGDTHCGWGVVRKVPWHALYARLGGKEGCVCWASRINETGVWQRNTHCGWALFAASSSATKDGLARRAWHVTRPQYKSCCRGVLLYILPTVLPMLQGGPQQHVHGTVPDRTVTVSLSCAVAYPPLPCRVARAAGRGAACRRCCCRATG